MDDESAPCGEPRQAVAALPAADELEPPELVLDELFELAEPLESADFDVEEELESDDDAAAALPASELLEEADEAAGVLAVEPLRLSVR